MPRLARPDAAARDSFLEAARALREEGWLADFPVEEVAADFGGYVARVRAETYAWGVPISTFCDLPSAICTAAWRSTRPISRSSERTPASRV